MLIRSVKLIFGNVHHNPKIWKSKLKMRPSNSLSFIWKSKPYLIRSYRFFHFAMNESDLIIIYEYQENILLVKTECQEESSRNALDLLDDNVVILSRIIILRFRIEKNTVKIVLKQWNSKFRLWPGSKLDKYVHFADWDFEQNNSRVGGQGPKEAIFVFHSANLRIFALIIAQHILFNKCFELFGWQCLKWTL